MDELKPCPFCGGEAELSNSASGIPLYQIWCKNPDCIALAIQVKHFDKERLINAWNTRATPIPYTPEMVSALDDAYEAGRKSVDRTCEIVKVPFDWVCSECDYPIHQQVKYCPGCGAKVVE